MKIYKIRRKSDGKFVTDNNFGIAFDSIGTSWGEFGLICRFIRQYLEYLQGYWSSQIANLNTVWGDCEIVEYELREISAKDI